MNGADRVSPYDRETIRLNLDGMNFFANLANELAREGGEAYELARDLWQWHKNQSTEIATSAGVDRFGPRKGSESKNGPRAKVWYIETR